VLLNAREQIFPRQCGNAQLIASAGIAPRSVYAIFVDTVTLLEVIFRILCKCVWTGLACHAQSRCGDRVHVSRVNLQIRQEVELRGSSRQADRFFFVGPSGAEELRRAKTRRLRTC